MKQLTVRADARRVTGQDLIGGKNLPFDNIIFTPRFFEAAGTKATQQAHKSACNPCGA